MPAATPASATVPRAAAGHLGFDLPPEEVETALLTGEHAPLLEDYFGPAQYDELVRLSREAASRTVRGGPPVLILPGIMGSTIGRRGQPPARDNIYWFDPIDIMRGRLHDLRLPSGSGFSALGVILFAYIALKLRLRRAGFDASFYPFDWRLSIADLGRDLADHLKKRGGEKVALVAHSMGGLVARRAVADGAPFSRLVMLGTPNFGSFAPVQALRATYPVVRKVAALDLRRSPEQLARDVFSTFPGLTEMLPAPERWSDVDLFDLANWPPGDLRPRAELLKRVIPVRELLEQGRDEFYMIVGVHQPTTTGMRRDNGQFVYETTADGDGTVPRAFAELPGCGAHHYVVESHGSLPNNGRVARAVADLLDSGRTDALPDSFTPRVRMAAVEVSDDALRIEYFGGRRELSLSRSELRHMLDEVASPESRDLEAVVTVAGTPAAALPVAPVGPGFQHPFERVVVGRRRQHRIDLRFAFGSITEVDERAIALGVFRDVAPAGPAMALDRRLDGAITELTQRRMFSGNVGEVFMLPTGRHPIGADMVAFVGLGPFDQLTGTTLQTAAENVIRTLIRARIEEFATVLFGAGSGTNPAEALKDLLTGFFRGLCDADRDHHFRRIVLCERDAERYAAMKAELYRLSSTSLCEAVELTFDEITLPAERVVDAVRGVAPARTQSVYLIVRQQSVSGAGATRTLAVRSSLLTAGQKATVITGVRGVAAAELERARKAAVSERVTDLARPGGRLAELVLADEIRGVLPHFRDRHLVIVHDAAMSRVPWETIALDGAGNGSAWFPAAVAGVSRRYEADNLSVAKWLEERVLQSSLRILLVVDPTNDLKGAVREARRLRVLFGTMAGVRVDELAKSAATHRACLDAFSSGAYDVIHYAGHAYFDEDNPERSGIVCHNGAILSGAELSTLSNLPSLVFFNACESGRLRKVESRVQRAPGAKGKTQKSRTEQVETTVGFAEAFMRGGVANFLGTYWPVGDDAAEAFASTFYREILRGAGINAAIQAGRAEVRKTDPRDWANYVFYGDPNFVLKAVG